MKRALAQAVDWYVRLNESTVSPATHSQWQAWLAADPQHAQAWARLEHLQQRLAQAPAAVGAATLEQARQQRRAAVKMLALLLGVGVVGWQGYQLSPWQADYATRVGQRRHLTLADGSRLVLDTDTQVNLHFDGQQRLIQLHRGEVLIQTASDPARRPFIVHTEDGSVRALGTRFNVRQLPGQTRVGVLESAVEVRPLHHPTHLQRLNAGQQVTFDREHVDAVRALPSGADAWASGMLSVDDWRLADFIGELSRYRAGYLGCAEQVADLRISGAFRLDDIDGVLDNLQISLPVKVRRFSKYWVRIEG